RVAARSFLGRAFLPGLALRRDFLVVEVAECARGGVHGEHAVLLRLDVHVVERHDARELADVAREGAHVVVGAHDLHRDRQLGIELALRLAGRRPEQLELQPAPEAGLVDVDQERVHLRAVGQLAQQGAELRVDLAQLLAVQVEVDRLLLLVDILGLQLLFLAAAALEHLELALRVEEIARGRDGGEDREQRGELRDRRPGARILRVEMLEIFRYGLEVERHGSAFFRRRLRRRLGGVLRGFRALHREVHVEFGHAPLVGRLARLHLDQLRRLEPGRTLDVAHERGDARVRLRVADDVDPQPLLHHGLEIHAFRRLLHQLVEQAHGLGAVGLQGLDHLLAREQRRDLLLQAVDLGDVLVELDDLALEEAVAVRLRFDLRGVQAVDREHDDGAEQPGAAGEDEEVLPGTLAPLGAVRQQVYARGTVHDGSNLRMARPQATISEGASTIRRFSWIRGEVCIAAKGLATEVGTWVRVFTASSMPAITAEPPASRMWSTL